MDEPTGSPDGRYDESDLVEVLRDGGAVGGLVYTNPWCQPVELVLPELDREPLGASRRCLPDPESTGWRKARKTDQRLVEGSDSVREVARLGTKRVAAIVHDRELGLDVLAVFEDGLPVSPPALAHPGLTGLAVSPRRGHMAVRSDSGKVFVLDREGRFALPGRFRFSLLETRAVAWSPDDRWTVLATRSRLYILETDPATTEVVELPIVAVNVSWE